MAINLTCSTITYEANGTECFLSISHPSVSEERIAAIRRYLEAGCDLLVDLDHLPEWASHIPVEAQTAALKIRPELFQYYKLRVPRSVTLSRADWRNLPQLAELRHLSISCADLTPDDVVNVLSLNRLEILVLHSSAIDDSFCLVFPYMKQLRAVDVMGTQVTSSGVQALHDKCPNAKVYADCDA
jgi:hypothetical protein